MDSEQGEQGQGAGGLGTIYEKKDPHGEGSTLVIKTAGPYATDLAKEGWNATIENFFINEVDNRPVPVEPIPGAPIFDWFAYQYTRQKKGQSLAHKATRIKYNARCEPSDRIPSDEAWRQRYKSWKDRTMGK